MKDVQAFIDSLNWDEYITILSKFWVREIGYDPNENGFAKVAVKLIIEEERVKTKYQKRNL